MKLKELKIEAQDLEDDGELFLTYLWNPSIDKLVLYI